MTPSTDLEATPGTLNETAGAVEACPNPWCKGTAIIAVGYPHTGTWKLVCQSCNIFGPRGKSREEARDLWNQRTLTAPDDAGLVERVATALCSVRFDPEDPMPVTDYDREMARGVTGMGRAGAARVPIARGYG